MKLIVLIIGVGIGFGGGVWWGVQHPQQAASLSNTEQQQFLQAQLKIAEAVKSKLDTMATKSNASGNSIGSGFVSGGPSVPAPDLNELRSAQDTQIQQLRNRLAQLNK